MEIDLKNLQELVYQPDGRDVVTVRYTTSVESGDRPPVEIDVEDDEEANRVINEIMEARREFIKDSRDDTVEIEV